MSTKVPELSEKEKAFQNRFSRQIATMGLAAVSFNDDAGAICQEYDVVHVRARCARPSNTAASVYVIVRDV